MIDHYLAILGLSCYYVMIGYYLVLICMSSYYVMTSTTWVSMSCYRPDITVPVDWA